MADGFENKIQIIKESGYKQNVEGDFILRDVINQARTEYGFIYNSGVNMRHSRLLSMRLDSTGPIEDTSDDKGPEKDDGKSSSFRHREVRKDDESKHCDIKRPIERICQESYLNKGTPCSCTNIITEGNDDTNPEFRGLTPSAAPNYLDKSNRIVESSSTTTMDTVTKHGVSKVGKPGSNRKEEHDPANSANAHPTRTDVKTGQPTKE